jgi:putative hydrolase of the HAD superfamily
LEFDILLFDLIGVLVKDDEEISKEILSAAHMSMPELMQRWSTSPAVRSFETGRSPARDFGVNMVRELDLSIAASEFLELIRRWAGGLYEGTEALLGELSQTYRLGCFSNNNEITWPQVRDHLGMGQLLDEFFLSHEIGMVKPDIAAFEHVIEQLDVKPNRIAFFDDLEVNVRSAQQVGMEAFVTRGLPEVRERLAGLGLLSLGG